MFFFCHFGLVGTEMSFFFSPLRAVLRWQNGCQQIGGSVIGACQNVLERDTKPKAALGALLVFECVFVRTVTGSHEDASSCKAVTAHRTLT